MQRLAERHAPAEPLLPLSPADWELIDDPDEARAVLAELQRHTRSQAFECAEQYELAYPGYPGDRGFYMERGQSGRVLYLGVGTGRIFAPLAERNPRAVGVEYSQAMIDRLRERAPHMRNGRLIAGDAARIALPERHFDTILAPHSFLQVIPSEDVPRLLERVRRALRPGGRFCTDTFSPYLIPFRNKGLEVNIRRIGAETRIATYILYDHLRQRMTELAHVQDADAEHLLEMNLHYYFPRELVERFEAAGFEPVTLTGDYGDEPFNPAVHEVVVYEARTPRH